MAFIGLRPIWKSGSLSTNTKTRIYRRIRAVLLYGTESWKMAEADMTKLKGFDSKWISNIFWPYVISSRDSSGVLSISGEITKRRRKWIGHARLAIGPWRNSLYCPDLDTWRKAAKRTTSWNLARNCNKKKDQAGLELMDCGRAYS